MTTERVQDFTVENDRVDLPRGATARTKRVKVGWRGRQIIALSQGDFRNYIYPVFTPSGIQVTAESPIDHPHHQSVTIGADHFNCRLPYSDDKFEEANYSFYVNYVFQGRAPGRIVSRTLEDTQIDEKHLQLVQDLDWKGPEEWGAPNRRTVAVERRTIDVRVEEKYNLIDIYTKISPTEWDISIGPTRHAFFTIRIADGLRVVDGGALLDSEGRNSGDAISGKSSKWVDAYGCIYDDSQVGVAVFPDPSVNAPYWGVADYGTLTVNPLFYKPWELGVGDFVETGIRLVVHDGSPYEARIADLYDDFSSSIK